VCRADREALGLPAVVGARWSEDNTPRSTSCFRRLDQRYNNPTLSAGAWGPQSPERQSGGLGAAGPREETILHPLKGTAGVWGRQAPEKKLFTNPLKGTMIVR